MRNHRLIALARPRFAQGVALVGLALLAATIAVSHVDRSAAGGAAGERPGAPATSAAPTLSIAPDLVSRAWFVSRDVGWIVVQVRTAGLPRMELQRTTDAGTTWQPQLGWAGGAGPEAARFFGPNEAFVMARVDSGPRRIFTTIDGAWWRTGQSPSSAAAVSFIDANRGWAAYSQGAGVAVERTADGGQTWERLTTFAAPDLSPHAWVEFIDAQAGLMGGLAEGRLAPVYATHDGGVTWAAAVLPAPPERVSAGGSSALSSARALAGGAVALDLSIYLREGYSYAHSYLYMSGDGGRSWSRPMPLPGAEWQALDQLRVVATSGQALFASGDGGRTWRRTEASLPAPQPRDGVAFNAFRFAAPAFIDDRIGWATLVTTQRCQGAAHPKTCAEHPQVVWAIARTSDGGSTWTLVYSHA